VFGCSYRVWCDAGCLQNGTQEAQGYAPYSLESGRDPRQVVRLRDLSGITTNNQAGHVALISALVHLRRRIERPGKSALNHNVVIRTDSQFLVGQLTQCWKAKAANVRPLLDEAESPMKALGQSDLTNASCDEGVRFHR
jgi:ribonuclease HI